MKAGSPQFGKFRATTDLSSSTSTTFSIAINRHHSRCSALKGQPCGQPAVCELPNHAATSHTIPTPTAPPDLPRNPLAYVPRGLHLSHCIANNIHQAGFYVALAALPLAVAAYRLTSGGEDLPYITRQITATYDSYAIKWAERNDVHTQAVEAAGRDRVLFLGETDRKARTIDLKFPEWVCLNSHLALDMLTRYARQFNGGSPWNVPAGQGHINLDHVIAKYEKEAYEANEKKLEQLRTNTVPAERPFKPLAKDTPAIASA